MTRKLIAVLLDWDRRHPGGAWKGAGRWPERREAASRDWRLGRDHRDHRDNREVPEMVLRAQKRLAASRAPMAGNICSALVNGAARKRAPCHIPAVSVVPAVSARPPSNEIPCWRPVH